MAGEPTYLERSATEDLKRPPPSFLLVLFSTDLCACPMSAPLNKCCNPAKVLLTKRFHIAARYHILMPSVIYYCTDSRKLGIYLSYIIKNVVYSNVIYARTDQNAPQNSAYHMIQLIS